MDTKTCKRCGASGLKWNNTQPDKKGDWYFTDAVTGARHVCNRNGRQHLQDAPEAPAPEAPAPAEAPKPAPAPATPPSGGTDAQAVLDGLKRMLEQQAPAAGAAPDMDAIRAMVESAVGERLPRPVLIRLPDGTGHQVESAHAELPDLIQAMALRFNTLMVGPAGSGKSTAARQAADALKLPYFEKTMGPATSEWDLTGYRSPDGRYIAGALRAPYEFGGVLFLDELDNSNAETLTTLNGALANGHCQFPDGMVDRHADFVCVAAGNTYGRGADRLYVGRQQLDAATLDRFWVIDWDYDESVEANWAGTDQSEWVAFVQRARRVAADLHLRVVISPRASIDGAKALRSGMHPDKVEKRRLWSGISVQDRERIQAGMAA